MLYLECNCHDHADTCIFSPYVYASTGNVSGGICENCTHNTEGLKCEFCKEGYYRDPVLELNHPEVCKGKRKGQMTFFFLRFLISSSLFRV